ncbi:universal stress protein [Halopiger xanaduensis]|nr:universal stress protein [Halopiger xanaduensis]
MASKDEPTAADALRAADDPREHARELVRNGEQNRPSQRDRRRPATGPSRVLVPFDGSDPSCGALEAAFKLFPDAAVTALTIVDDSTISYVRSPSSDPNASAEGELLRGLPSELERATEIAERRDERIQTAGRIGSATRGILEYVEREAVDHVVIGSLCRTGIARLLRGSVAETVVRHSSVPVTVIPASSVGGEIVSRGSDGGSGNREIEGDRR